MKQYQKKRNLSSERPATQTLPVLPDFAASDPSVGELVYRWFDQNGNYLGWTGYDTGRKFLLGKLYYKTKGAYKIRTLNSHTSRTTKKIYIREKDTHNLAAYAVLRTIEDDDLIDSNDREALCKITLEKLNAHTFSVYYYDNYPNPYKVIPDEMRSKIQKDMQNFLASKQQELIDYVQNAMNDERKAKQTLTEGTESTNGEWIIDGLV